MEIGTAWTAGEDVQVPTILQDTMGELCHPKDGLRSISLATEEGDPSAARDITDLIYHPCWWRCSDRYKATKVDGINILKSSFHHPDDVSQLRHTGIMC